MALDASTSFAFLTPVKKMQLGTGVRSAMYQKSGTPNTAAFEVMSGSPANQSWMNGSTPSWADIARSAVLTLRPLALTKAESSFK